MAIFAISFRVHEDATYRERYVSIVRSIEGLTTSTVWDEPTSFYLIESSMSSAEIADAINANSSFAPNKDLLLVINISQIKGHKAIGQIESTELKKLMAKR